MQEEGDRVKRILNESLKGAFGRREYDCVKVLAIHWKCSDLDFESEAFKITEFFEEKLAYQTDIFQIPSSNGSGELKDKLEDFLLPQGSPQSLYIIHYGGHGDEDYRDHGDRRRRGVWAATKSGQTSLNWSDIQPSLGKAAGDVLLILDCCHGAQAMRESSKDRVIPGNVELLAACAMGVKTPLPGPYSFTSKLIKELERNVQSHGYAHVSAVHTYLLQEDHHLSQSPIRTPLLGRRETIRLERLDTSTSIGWPSRETASLSFHIPLSQDPTEMVLDEIIAWLKDRPPRTISSEASFKAVVLHAQPLRDYIRPPQEREASLTAYNNLSRSSNKDVQRKWLRFGGLLQSALTYMKWNTPTASTTIISGSEEANDLASILLKLEESIVTLQNTIDRGILEIPELNDESRLQQAIEETMIARLQATVESLKIRRIGKLASQQLEVPCAVDYAVTPGNDKSKPFQTLSLVNHESHDTVLVEYKYYDKKDMSNHQVDIDKARMQRLFKVLEMPTPGEFGTLKCLECLSEPYLARYALHFEPPEGYESLPTSLRETLLSKRRGRPTLGQRFMIAKSVGQALLKWHATGWVHQSIASHNVIFFRRHGSTNLDFSKPYLCGFEYARVVGFISSPRHPAHLEPEYDLYRHKDRQGKSLITHRKEHDIYSFGLLMLEIGSWDTLKDIFFDDKRIDPAKLYEEILKRGDAPLRFDMGKAYEQAALKCIRGSFHIEEDDMNQSRLARAFESEVVQRIVQGRDIDNVGLTFRV